MEKKFGRVVRFAVRVSSVSRTSQQVLCEMSHSHVSGYRRADRQTDRQTDWRMVSERGKRG